MRRIFSLLALSSLAAAMALAAVPRPAAAATEALVSFVLTIYGPSPSGDTLALFLETPPGSGQIFVFCAPLSHPGPNPAGPCQGGGKHYTINFSFPSGTDLFYQFQDIGPSGRLTILQTGGFPAFPAPGGGVSATVGGIVGMPPISTHQHQCGCGTGLGFGLPNTAVAAPVAARREAVLPALGILMVLIAAMMFARRRWAELPAPISRR